MSTEVELREDLKLPLRIVYLMESCLAAMKFHQLCLPCVAVFGWSVSEAQAAIVSQLAKGVVCLPDRNKREELTPGRWPVGCE